MLTSVIGNEKIGITEGTPIGYSTVSHLTFETCLFRQSY
jgi:hypothetical protein